MLWDQTASLQATPTHLPKHPTPNHWTHPLTWHLKRAARVGAGRGVRIGAAAAARRVGVAAVGRVGERVAVGVLERVWERGVQWHVRLILSQVAELSQKAVLRIVLAVPRNQHRRENWRQKETEREIRTVKTVNDLTVSEGK